MWASSRGRSDQCKDRSTGRERGLCVYLHCDVCFDSYQNGPTAVIGRDGEGGPEPGNLAERGILRAGREGIEGAECGDGIVAGDRCRNWFRGPTGGSNGKTINASGNS